MKSCRDSLRLCKLIRNGATVDQPAPRWPYADLAAVFGIVIFSVLACLPVFQFKMMSGHDTYAYLPRTIEFYEGLRSGHLLPRWAPDLGGGYGQPVFNFNPPLVYYLPSLIHYLGFSFVASINLTCFLLMGLSGMGMYLLAREFFGRKGGFIAAVAYIFAPYHLVCLYVRFALADFSAFPFIPLALWGIYRYTRDGKHSLLMVSVVSVTLLVLASNSVALMAVPMLIAYVVFMAWQARDLSYVRKGLLALMLGLALSAFFALPAMLEHRLVKTEQLLVGYQNYADHFVYLRQFILSPWGYGISVAGPKDRMSFEIGFIHLLAAGICLCTLKRAPTDLKLHLRFFLVVFASAIFFSTAESVLLWQELPLLRYLQFPFRFLTIIAMTTSFMCGFPLLARQDRPNVQNVLFVALLAGIFLLGFQHAKPEGFYEWTDADFSPDSIAQQFTSVTIAEEYEPIWVQERPGTPSLRKLEPLQGMMRILRESIQPTRYDFLVEADEPSLLRVNTFYFPGWRVFVDGQQSQLDYSNQFGLMTFRLGQGTHEVRVEFADTPLRKLATSISIATLAFLLVTWVTAAIAKRRSDANARAAIDNSNPTSFRHRHL